MVYSRDNTLVFLFRSLPSTCTNVFIEYGYLVKKVVFKIEVLPMVKIISALFVHVFFYIIYICNYGHIWILS